MNFVKMHGLGNDYIYFDCVNEPAPADPPALARYASDRHFGVGGDGIVLILPHDAADFQMRMFNADGSEAEMCGNAIRCVGKLVRDRGYATSDTIRVATGAGILELQLFGGEDGVEAARVDMGRPILNGPDVPVAIEANPVVNATLEAGGKHVSFTAVSMGNPHCVIFVDEITDEDVLGIGPKIEKHELFPNRINVEFIRVISRSEVDMRVWERGSGETMACGTGAAAVGVAGVLNDLTDRKITVHLLGGDLEIEWAEDDHVYMTGPATHVFSGELAWK
jgi:diaminopimelate epimerase